MRLETLKGIGEKRKQTLEDAGITTVDDLLFYFPRRYDKRRISTLDTAQDSPQAHYVEGVVMERPNIHFIKRNLSRLTFRAMFEDVELNVAVFNQHYLKRTLYTGARIVALGDFSTSKRSVTARKVFLKERFQEGMLPVYNIEGFSDRSFQNIVLQALKEREEPFFEAIPREIRRKRRLINVEELLEKAHAPKNEDDIEAVRQRLAYEEFFTYQLKVHTSKHFHRKDAGEGKIYDESRVMRFIRSLPFSLTTSQKEALDTILEEVGNAHAMRRMLQGDTGSGKTIVALIAAYATYTAGRSSAFMAPTSALAHQHYETFQSLLEGEDVPVYLLTGSATSDYRRRAGEAVENGVPAIYVGTQALLSSKLIHAEFGLVVTDEQHRFGVAERAGLKERGRRADVLYLSATPIPRTFAMTLFGDMDVSAIEKKVADDQVKTEVKQVSEGVREEIERTLSEGLSVFLIAPSIEDSEYAKGVESLYEHAKDTFKSINVGMLHGRMKEEDKSEVMEAFKNGDIRLLVATTVVEVGIDIEHAALMVVHHAERLGLSQLHQLRGRVGRGRYMGKCVFLYDGDETVRERLLALKKSDDGFALSEMDLKQRGAGDLLGTLQSGRRRFAYISFNHDLSFLKRIRDDASALVERYYEHGAAGLAPLFKRLGKALEEGGRFLRQ